MDVFYAYTYGTAGWLSLQALPLIITPKLVISLLANEAHLSTDVEIYFSRCLGFSLLSTSIIALFFTGSIPLSSDNRQVDISSSSDDMRSPYATPIVAVTAWFQFFSLIYCYMRYVDSSSTGYVLGAIGNGSMAAFGFWCVLFGSPTGGRFSKRTGADKRMAGFPFGNSKAYDKRKDRKMG